ncbi:MAG TPA: hemerythrin domain-containing protein [Steroidobacteraceae bacterium]|nr:hemerythrin domain-containing protein [Steroidobacteraceae bacterium]
MSLLDKMIAAVTPSESEESRADARRQARAAAGNGDWLSMILDQHDQVERAFAAVKAAPDRARRVLAHKWLATILIGHANAEETAIYPALTAISERSHATVGYSEQATVKVQLGLLETLDPMSRAYLDKLEHLEGVVQHHVYAEESNWLLDLKRKVPASQESRLTRRYKEELERYLGDERPPRASS